MKRIICSGLMLLLLIGCGQEQARHEKEAERLYYVAFRDLEEKMETLPNAISHYEEVAQKYAKTAAGTKARARHAQLVDAQKLLEGSESLEQNQWVPLYTRVDSVAPGYPPVVRRLGRFYYNNTYLASRTGAMTLNPTVVEGVLVTWAKQDSLWANYEFRPTPADREWQDNLCKQATDIARMLEEARRYEDALRVIRRGLAYANGEDAIAHAQVFAAFYMFRTAKHQEGIELAQKALAYEFLSKEDRARSYHVIGLCYSVLYQRSKKMADLDAAIEALNQAVVVNPELHPAREMLKALRKQRQSIPS